jgi:hypothetical protein
MTDLDKYLNMLKSPKVSVRYDACEELRVATESSPEAILALEDATKDKDEFVAERAQKALAADVHQRMGVKMGRAWPFLESKSESQTEPEPEQPVNKAKNLAIGSMVLGIFGMCFSTLNAFGYWLAMSNCGGDGCGDFGVFFLLPMLFLDAVAGLLLGLAGLIPGMIAFHQITKETENGKALAITGIVLGTINCLQGIFIFAILKSFT